MAVWGFGEGLMMAWLLLFYILMKRTRFYMLASVLFLAPVFLWAESPEGQMKSPVLKKAQGYLKENKPSEALNALSGYRSGSLSEQLEVARYHFISAETYEALGKPPQAVEHYRQAYIYFPMEDMKALSLLKRGELQVKMQYFHEAKAVFSLLMKNFPRSSHIKKARLGMAESLYGMGHLREAIEYYEQSDYTAEVAYQKANALQRLGMLEKADEAYSSALASYPGYVMQSDEVKYYLGENNRLRGRHAEARKYLSSVKDSPFRARAEIGLGLIAAEEMKAEEAEKHFSAALPASDMGVRRQAVLNLSELRMKTGKVKEAEAGFEEIRVRYPYNREYDRAVLALSKIRTHEGNPDAAVKLLKELVLRRSPLKDALDQFEVIFRDVLARKDEAQLAGIWRSAGSWLLDNSREKFLLEMLEGSRVITREYYEVSGWLARNGSADARHRGRIALARFHLELGDIASAEEWWKKTSETKKKDDDMLRLEAAILYSRKKFGAAGERLMSVEKMEKTDLRMFGAVIGMTPNPGKALARYEKAVIDTGGDADSCTTLADIFYGKGRRAEALKYYRQALSHEADNEWAIYRTALLSPEDDAIEMLKKISGGASPVGISAGLRLREIMVARKAKELF